MNFYAFVEGPLLWAAFLIFIIGSLVRAALFFIESREKDKIIYQYFNWTHVLTTFVRWLLPINKTVTKNPVVSILGYVFHLCLIVLPIWIYQHVIYWEVSRFEWSWAPIPAGLADGMTLVFIAIAIFFLIRRIVSPDVRLLSSFSDYFILVVTVLPFLTGYFLTHGTLDGISLFKTHMQLIHILSGELMLILIPFTKLSHFILFFFSRGASSIEFGRRGFTI
jgi:nitrate reductase gamma subunit